MQIKTCSKCGARWISNQLYWSSGKPGKEEDLAGLVCNQINDPNCINPKIGDESGQSWEKRLKMMDDFHEKMLNDPEFDL